MTSAKPRAVRVIISRTSLASALVTAAACIGPVVLARSAVDGPAIANEIQGFDWLSYGRTYSEHHYSPLGAVNSHNVRQLGLAWSLDLPGERTLEATPLEVDGVLYFTGTYGKAYAVDARSGQLLWVFDPDFAHYNPQVLRMTMGGHRGVAYWKGKVYVAVVDGRLFALDAGTGKPVWSKQTFDAPDAHKAISGAPRIFNGKVLIGHGGAEFATRGYVTAYDAETGAQLWRFYTVPGDPHKGFESAAMAMAAQTWNGQWWKWGGGGTAWDNFTYDPDLNRVYIGVGNGGPWNSSIRSPGHGDNLFLCSIVALDADTGQYIWHYQMNPRESWDWKATTNMVLADIDIAGSKRKVLMQAPSNGFFYVIDRMTGKLISAEKYAKATWADRIDLHSGRPVEASGIRYQNGPAVIWPSIAGAHGWQPMSFNPSTGLVYIPVVKQPERIEPANDLQNLNNPTRRYFQVLGSKAQLPKIDPDDGTSSLVAWDPVAQMKRWDVHYDGFWNGGTMTTAGNLVFQGTGAGQFVAYDAGTGRTVWSFDTGLGIIGAPITYQVDGVQYVSILVGYGGSAGNGGKIFDYGWRFDEQPRRLLAFALGKSMSLPTGNRPPRYDVRAIDDASIVIDSKLAARGLQLFHSTCVGCHGVQLESTGSIAPDLRESRLAMNWDSFRSVVHDGLFASANMPKYDDLTEQDLRGLYMYIRQRARESVRQP